MRLQANTSETARYPTAIRDSLEMARPGARWHFLRPAITIGAIALLALYLLVLPSGLLSVFIPVVCLVAIASQLNRPTLACLLILVAPQPAGAVARAFHMPGGGAIGAIGLGYLLLWPDRLRLVRFNWHGPGIWMALMLGTILVAFLGGPMTPDSTQKLILTVLGTAVSVAAFTCTLSDERFDLFGFSIGAIGLCIMHFGAVLYQYPAVVPGSIFNTGEFRAHIFEEDIGGISINIGRVAMIGLMSLLGALGHRRLTMSAIVCAVPAFACGLLVLNSMGQRAYAVILPVAGVLMAATGCRNRRFIALVIGCILLLVGLVASQMLEAGDKRATRAFGESGSLLERLDRQELFEAAVAQFCDRPILGYGLGGYYCKGIFVAGEGHYPHNLVLEVLAEMGLLGAAVVLGPPCFLLFARRGRWLGQQTLAHRQLLPLVLLLSLQPMVNGDLTDNYRIFSYIAAAWAVAGMASQRDAGANGITSAPIASQSVHQQMRPS